MSRLKPVKQPVFGSSGEQYPGCGRWFPWANYWRDYKRVRRPLQQVPCGGSS
jgi:hypothetical protein